MTDRTQRMEALARLAAPGSGATEPERDTAMKILKRMRTEDCVRVPADFRDHIHLVVEDGPIGFDSFHFHFHYTGSPWPWTTGFDPAANMKVGVCGQDVMDVFFPLSVFGFAELNQYDPMRNLDLSVRQARLWDQEIRYVHEAGRMKVTGPCPDCKSVVSFAVDDEMYSKIERVWTPLARVGLLQHFARLVCPRCKEEAEKKRKEVSNG